MATFETLPQELVDNVCGRFSTADLNKCRLTNRLTGRKVTLYFLRKLEHIRVTCTNAGLQ
jgi:hypothetical protein